MSNYPKECLLQKVEADPSNPIDVGEGWTLFINWVREMSRNIPNQDTEKPCKIRDFTSRVKGYKKSESPRATHDQLSCQRCNQIVDVSIFRSDANER